MDNIVYEYNINLDDEIFLTKLENFSFSFKISGFKINRDYIDLNELSKIPSIKNKKILYNERFIKSFYRIFWELISKLGIATYNFYDFIDKIVYEMNRITLQDYVISDCHSTDKYNCGRAMMILEGNGKTKFIIFNSDNGIMDINTQLLYLGCEKNNLNEKTTIESRRIVKEIQYLSKEFNVKVYQNGKDIKLVLVNIINPKIVIKINLPEKYPFESPSGTFNDLTISEIDIDWSVEKKLKDIVDKLMYKYNNKLFPKHREILCYLLDL